MIKIKNFCSDDVWNWIFLDMILYDPGKDSESNSVKDTLGNSSPVVLKLCATANLCVMIGSQTFDTGGNCATSEKALKNTAQV